MADFHQNGHVATLHNLRADNTGTLERELEVLSAHRKITLILPSLFSELEGPALANIVKELSGARFISNIVIGLDRATEAEYRHAREFFSVLPQPHSILWNDGPRLKAIDTRLKEAGLSPEEPGKGRNVWYCIGYTLARRDSDVVALHDCDIVTYSREMLARLIYPVANPAFSYLFCKARSSGLTSSRLTRPFILPPA